MITLSENPLILQTEFELEDKDFLINVIRKKATRDQSKTAIRLNVAYSKIYQPWKEDIPDFEPCRQIFTAKISEMLKGKYVCKRDLWGLDYENGEGTSMHDHGGTNNNAYSAIYYLVADEGCGSLVFGNPWIEIEPKPNMFVLFDCKVLHGVLPAVNEKAKRTCIAMNARFDHESIRLPE